MKTVKSRAEAACRRVMHVLFRGPVSEKTDQWLRIMALELQRMVTWSLTALDERLRSATARWGTSNSEAAAFAQASFQFKLWHVLALMGGVSVMAPLVVLPNAPIFLGPICAFNSVVGTVLVVKARRL
jgi:hypothetical protein